MARTRSGVPLAAIPKIVIAQQGTPELKYLVELGR